MNNLIILPENTIISLPYSVSSIYFAVIISLGIYVIINNNPVVSVLNLIGVFMVTASYLMYTGVDFIGLSYILVYVGAVSILFLFILMLINVRISELTTDNNNGVSLSIITISVFSIVYSKSMLTGNTVLEGLIYPSANIVKLDSTLSKDYTLDTSKLLVKNMSTHFANSNTWDTFLSYTSHITSIGNVLYTLHPILLFITSIILLLSMIGSIIITLKQ